MGGKVTGGRAARAAAPAAGCAASLNTSSTSWMEKFAVLVNALVSGLGSSMVIPRDAATVDAGLSPGRLSGQVSPALLRLVIPIASRDPPDAGHDNIVHARSCARADYEHRSALCCRPGRILNGSA
ncbi:hypothetical protein ACQ5SK_14360 [Bradyrhizobium japonicum]